ncbi:hypothetical protein F4780DRAFT_630130 [Xylariomycetidae sp. FL0641]|nr:hypothetical protein F4780DRAFT_630130 [Xylariomycetidae sp. FL0641]
MRVVIAVPVVVVSAMMNRVVVGGSVRVGRPRWGGGGVAEVGDQGMIGIGTGAGAGIRMFRGSWNRCVCVCVCVGESEGVGARSGSGSGVGVGIRIGGFIGAIRAGGGRGRGRGRGITGGVGVDSRLFIISTRTWPQRIRHPHPREWRCARWGLRSRPGRRFWWLKARSPTNNTLTLTSILRVLCLCLCRCPPLPNTSAIPISIPVSVSQFTPASHLTPTVTVTTPASVLITVTTTPAILVFLLCVTAALAAISMSAATVSVAAFGAVLEHRGMETVRVHLRSLSVYLFISPPLASLFVWLAPCFIV